MMKLLKVTSEENEVKYEVSKRTESFGGYDSYITTLTEEEAKQLKVALNERRDI